MDGDRYCSPPKVRDCLVDLWARGADLDPCADPDDFCLARRRFDVRKGQDGLSLPWSGRVYCNPPYSEASLWVERCSGFYTSGAVSEAVALLNTATETEYWHKHIWPTATAVCFVRRRISFYYAGKKMPGNRYGQAFIYWGSSAHIFEKAFSCWGKVVIVNKPLTHNKLMHRMTAMSNNEYPFIQDLVGSVGGSLYRRFKDMTLEQVLHAALPMVEEFVLGYRLSKYMEENGETDFEKYLAMRHQELLQANGFESIEDFVRTRSGEDEDEDGTEDEDGAEDGDGYVNGAGPGEEVDASFEVEPSKPEPSAKKGKKSPPRPKKAGKKQARGGNNQDEIAEEIVAVLREQNESMSFGAITSLLKNEHKAHNVRTAMKSLTEQGVISAEGAKRNRTYALA